MVSSENSTGSLEWGKENSLILEAKDFIELGLYCFDFNVVVESGVSGGDNFFSDLCEEFQKQFLINSIWQSPLKMGREAWYELLQRHAEGQDLCSTVKEGYSLLMWAVEEGLFDVAEKLLGYDRESLLVNSANTYGEPPLFCASSRHMVELLLQHGASALVCDDTQSTALHHYAARNLIECVQSLPKEAARVLVNARDQMGRTPIFCAETREMVEELIRLGADTLVSDMEGNNLIHVYAERGLIRCILALPNARELVHKGNRKKETPLFFAKSRYMVKTLVELGADPCAKTDNGETVIHSFVARDLIDCTASLLAYGVSADTLDRQGRSGLHYAKSGEMVRLLIGANADLYIVDKEGFTSLHTAANAPVVQALIDEDEALEKCGIRDADLRKSSAKPLLLHAQGGDVAKALLDRGVDIKAKDAVRNTALHYATDALAVEALVEHGIGPEMCNKQGETPLHRARSIDTAKTFLRFDSNPNREDYSDMTPLLSILKWGVEELSELQSQEEASEASPSFEEDMMRRKFSFMATRRDMAIYWREPSRTVRDKLENCAEELRGMVCLLLDAGADPEQEGEGGVTPMKFAELLPDCCRAGVIQVLKDAIREKQERAGK